MTDTRTDHPWSTIDDEEPLAEGGAWLLDLVSAVDYLRRGLRPGFTVWDALAEAIRWWNEEQLATDGVLAPELCEVFWEWNDPFREVLRGLVALCDSNDSQEAAAVAQQAVRRWTTIVGARFNAGYPWPHPLAPGLYHGDHAAG